MTREFALMFSGVTSACESFPYNPDEDAFKKSGSDSKSGSVDSLHPIRFLNSGSIVDIRYMAIKLRNPPGSLGDSIF